MLVFVSKAIFLCNNMLAVTSWDAHLRKRKIIIKVIVFIQLLSQINIFPLFITNEHTNYTDFSVM